VWMRQTNSPMLGEDFKRRPNQRRVGRYKGKLAGKMPALEKGIQKIYEMPL
jgi:hypothetical protein